MPTTRRAQRQRLRRLDAVRMPPLAINGRPGAARRTISSASAVGMPQSANALASRRSDSVDARWFSTSLHDVPPEPATSMAATPASSQPARRSLSLMPQPTSFATTGTPTSRQTCLDLAQQPFPIPVPIRLQRLLQWVEVQDQRIGLDHLDCTPAVIDRVAVVELDGAQVGEEQDIRRDVPHPEGVRGLGLLQARALRAQAHRDAARLRASSQVAIDDAAPPPCRPSSRK